MLCILVNARLFVLFFFFFNDTATTEIYTLSLHDAVPIIQQGQVDFMRSPGATLDLLVKVDNAYKGGFASSRGLADFAVAQMRRLGIVDNGHDTTLGNFDTGRVQRLINIVVPIFNGEKKPVKANLTPADVVTNEFIDPSIGLR